ncbi:MAG: ABC transporter [Bacillota bacterium]|nr:MAG: ABC transporter [Bacillota bacterium]
MELQLDNVRKVYRGGTAALDGVTLTVGPGVFGLLGPNGAGKSTLLKILATLVTPTAGRVRVGPFELPRQQHEVRQRLGYLPQEFGWFNQLTVEETLDFAAIMKGIHDPGRRRSEIERWLAEVHLEHARHKRVGRLSGGMRRRLGIAQALLNDPSLVLLDEPTAGLDPEERVRFRHLLARLGGERVIILSTHVVEDVAAACDRVAVMAGGRLRWTGRPAELARLAAGMVWEVDEPVRGGAVVVAARREGGTLRQRVLSRRPPAPGARPAEPGVEDGYVALLSGLAGGEEERP